MRRLETSYSTLVWSDCGSLVTKTRPAGGGDRRRFVNELRVNRMLRQRRPPVATPRLVGHDQRRSRLTFQAIDGEPLGPKYPRRLPVEDVDALVRLGRRLETYRPRRRWFRRLDSAKRLELARRAGLLTDGQAHTLTELAARHHRRLAFAHGDLTARNVLRSRDHNGGRDRDGSRDHDGSRDGDGDGLWLIDWEWAGLYPPGYELAFLWFSLGDVEGGRTLVEQRDRAGPVAFLLSALIIQLWHLQWYIPAEFRDAHLASRDSLVGRLTGSVGECP